jgi:hypothetical protein
VVGFSETPHFSHDVINMILVGLNVILQQLKSEIELHHDFLYGEIGRTILQHGWDRESNGLKVMRDHA